ncbi:podocan-like [Brevipalpus obovatus]|uniref:podocan-like n=1 Tax=Brevipalpus obovatus TaxID=246614 RepID=UPI003D9F01C4
MMLEGLYFLFGSVLFSLVIKVDLTTLVSDVIPSNISDPSIPIPHVDVHINISSSCPHLCLCDDLRGYVSCVGNWTTTLPCVSDNVTKLEIKFFNISQLELSHLSDLSGLKELIASSLNLVNISSSSFSHLVELEKLDLSANHLEILTSNQLAGPARSLRFLDISSNDLFSIEKAFSNCSSLKQLILANNKLTSILIDTFIGLSSLEYLNLQHNQIQSIEIGSFIHLVHLSDLIIANNPIVPTTRFDFTSGYLHQFDLSSTNMSSLPHGINPFLRDLRFVNNQLTSIGSNELANYPHLNVLVLDSNNIELIDADAFDQLEHLEELSLRENHLNNVPQGLPTSLKKLYLGHNLISLLSAGIVQHLINLEELSLNNNQLQKIDDSAFFGLKNLKILDISGNKIVNLPRKVILPLISLQVFNVSKNPFSSQHHESNKLRSNVETKI